MNIQGIHALISAPLQAASANSKSASASPNSSSSTSSSDLQTMFLNLLVTELQNQDPTQPVDPTEMVGQMISLNQLDQLISINQILGGLNTPPTTGSLTPAQSTQGPSGSSAPIAGKTLSERAGAPQQPLAFQPIPGYNGAPVPLMNLYNLYGSIGAPATRLNHITTLGGK